MANLRGARRAGDRAALSPLALTAKAFKVLYKILCLSLRERGKRYYLQRKVEGRRNKGLLLLCQLFCGVFETRLEAREARERRLEEFVIEGHNFTRRKCLENVNTANCRSQWSRMKALAASTQQRIPRRVTPASENPALTHSSVKMAMMSLLAQSSKICPYCFAHMLSWADY